MNKYTKAEINEMFSEELKMHYLKRDNPIVSVNNNISEYKENESAKKKDNKFLKNIRRKLVFQTIMCICIFTYIKVYPKLPDNYLKYNPVISWIKKEYNTVRTKEEIIESVEEKSKQVYNYLYDYIPEETANSFVNNYVENIKPKLLDFRFTSDKIENTVAVFNDLDEMPEYESVAVSKISSDSSELSLLQMDTEEVLNKKINIIPPVSGTITSTYGAREEVFKNVGYHTGLDIANSLNTKIQSATDGVVTSTVYMDKYYGNNIEIECSGVVFKYAHLNQINVKVGDTVSQGDIIGLMGSTGASTGSHLHFEIKINGRTVDPELILNFR